MKTVEITTGLSGYFNGVFHSLAKGDTIELPDAEVDRLIAAGYAKLPASQAAVTLSTLEL